MLKLWAYAFLVFVPLVLLVFLFTEGIQALSGSGLFPSVAASEVGSVGSGHGGLSVVNFDIFKKGGTGWGYVTQGYGSTPYSYLYIDHWHNGIDIAADYGAKIYSADDGIVIATGDQDDYCPGDAFGKFVVVKDASQNIDLMYAHLGTIDVVPGQNVSQGKTVLATVGSTGLETGPHLHFSVFKGEGFNDTPAHGCGPYPQGNDMNPVPYLEVQ